MASQEEEDFELCEGPSSMYSSCSSLDICQDQVLYENSDVYIHPSLSTHDRIAGSLLIVMQCDQYYIRWTPNENSSHSASSQYALRIPVEKLHSVRKRCPTFSYHHIILQWCGVSAPPLYFHTGGIKEFFSVLRLCTSLTKSTQDANCYLVNDISDPLRRSLSSWDMAASIATFPAGGPSSLPVTTSAHGERPGESDGGVEKAEASSFFADVAFDALSFATGGWWGNRGEIKQDYVPIALPPPLSQMAMSEFEVVPTLSKRGTPLSWKQWSESLDSEGRVVKAALVRKTIFYGGVEPELRRTVWKFLLGYYDWNSTRDQRKLLDEQKRSEYVLLKRQWQTMLPAQISKFAKFRERRHRIEKDIPRTNSSHWYFKDNARGRLMFDVLLTYSLYNFDVGYCQGMSDFLSPIVYVMDSNEEESFWCFVALMDVMEPNFHHDQQGMHRQLKQLECYVKQLNPPLYSFLERNDALNFFFCFRWLLCQFKREFPFDDVLRLWEVLWTHHITHDLHLFLAVGMLQANTHQLLHESNNEEGFDYILQYITQLSGTMSVDEALGELDFVLLRVFGPAAIADGDVDCVPQRSFVLNPPGLPDVSRDTCSTP